MHPENVRIAVDRSIEALATRPEDAGTIRLARYYADVMDSNGDQAWAARWLGPLLLDCLEQLGATPAARARITRGEPARGNPARLTALRAARH